MNRLDLASVAYQELETTAAKYSGAVSVDARQEIDTARTVARKLAMDSWRARADSPEQARERATTFARSRAREAALHDASIAGRRLSSEALDIISAALELGRPTSHP